MNSDYLVGTVLEDRYEILERIGSGGMATVYKAKCRVLNRFVAIKVLKDSLKYDAEVVKRFNAESRAAARLSHPNIVQVYDVSDKSGLDYIVMEYIDGITLKEYIAKRGPLPWREACDFAAQIGRALDCAHKNRIIHRDIKPHNVLLTKDGMLKVADFGIAQAATSETIVANNSNLGSVHYISPEQGRGGYTDERSDIYSLGVVLYEMLTGKLPFDGNNAVLIALTKLQEDPPDCRVINPDIPVSVAEITMKAISREQHARYQTAYDMISDLEAAGRMRHSDLEYKKDREKYETKRIDKERVNMHKGRKKKHNAASNGIKLILLAAAAVFLIGFGTYSFMSGGTQEYQVPGLLGYTLEEAEKVIEGANLRLDPNIEYEKSAEVEEGLVMSQTPGANQYVKKNRKIKLTISLGMEEETVEVPLVEGVPAAEAEEKLAAGNLKVRKQEKENETVPKGYVISQSPKSGTAVSKGYTVTIYVSKGKAEEEKTEEETEVKTPEQEAESQQVTVPKVVGYARGQAETVLGESGFVVVVNEEANSAQEGMVIAQNPAANSTSAKGSKVTITVSKGERVETIMRRKTFTLTIPESSPDTVHIQVIANGKVIHDADHQKSEGTVDIEVQASKDASVQAYIDGVLVVDKVIAF